MDTQRPKHQPDPTLPHAPLTEFQYPGKSSDAIPRMKKHKKELKEGRKLKAKLLLDATGSIGLEPDHNLADTIAFSSCKGLFGLTGASFICFNIFIHLIFNMYERNGKLFYMFM